MTKKVGTEPSEPVLGTGASGDPQHPDSKETPRDSVPDEIVPEEKAS